jgi:hypothetical protein
MKAINSQKGTLSLKPKSLDFRSLIHHHLNESASVPSKQPHSHSNAQNKFGELMEKKVENIEELEDAEKQIRYHIKMMEDK